MFWWLMKKIIFWLWAGWVASYLQRSLSAQVNATPYLWKQLFSAVRASGGYPGNDFWIFISYHIFLLNQVEGAIAIPPSNSAPLPLFCPSVCPSVCPSIGLLTTFSGFCTFADKSLGRNGIELEMQMFPDDLPLANIDADGYCCHFMRSSVRPTIHGLGFVYCIQSAWKKWPTIWHADVSRWLTLSIHGCLWILLLVCLSVHLSVCSFTAFSGGCAFADKSLGTNGIKFGAKEGGSHYWEMAVAITCGYGGYLLPLLAAHSSFNIGMSGNQIQICAIYCSRECNELC